MSDTDREAASRDGTSAQNRPPIAPDPVDQMFAQVLESAARLQELPSGAVLRVPTIDETLRIKAFLAIKRNQVRDYLDIAALSDRVGLPHAADVLAAMDHYYADQHAVGQGVSSQVARQLAEPRPRDSTVIGQLDSYQGLRPEWQQWRRVVCVCYKVASLMVERPTP